MYSWVMKQVNYYLGENNIYIGCQAGEQTTEGSNNVFLGHKAGHKTTDNSCGIAIGFYEVVLCLVILVSSLVDMQDMVAMEQLVPIILLLVMMQQCKNNTASYNVLKKRVL